MHVNACFVLHKPEPGKNLKAPIHCHIVAASDPFAPFCFISRANKVL